MAPGCEAIVALEDADAGMNLCPASRILAPAEEANSEMALMAASRSKPPSLTGSFPEGGLGAASLVVGGPDEESSEKRRKTKIWKRAQVQ